MASGAKRRKAAKKKKKDAAVINGNGDVKVNESDSGENSSSPASQDLEPQHNPFSKDEDKDPSPGNESKERSKKDGSWSVWKEDEVVEEMVGEAKSNNGELAGFTCSSLKDSTNGALKSVGVDDGSQVSEKNIDGLEMPTPEKEHSSIFAESESLAKEVIRVKDAAHAVQVFESYGVVQEKVIDAEESSKKIEEKVHPSEKSPDLKEVKEPRDDESSSLSNTTPSGRPSGETFGKQVRQSNVHIGNGEYLTGNSDVHKSAEKEVVLPILYLVWLSWFSFHFLSLRIKCSTEFDFDQTTAASSTYSPETSAQNFTDRLLWIVRAFYRLELITLWEYPAILQIDAHY